MTDTLQSGGCFGGDKVFDDCAKKAGHQIRHYSFLNHHLDTKGNAIILKEWQLAEADPYLRKANETLKRKIPKSMNTYTWNLLRRNYWQIKDTERVYAVAPIDWDTSLVKGGTGWAVTMALDKRLPEVYVYDLNKNNWYQADYGYPQWGFPIVWTTEMFGWKPPKPHGTYTGIGSRELTEKGEMAIRRLYD